MVCAKEVFSLSSEKKARLVKPRHLWSRFLCLLVVEVEAETEVDMEVEMESDEVGLMFSLLASDSDLLSLG